MKDFVAYTVMDADRGERFSTTNFMGPSAQNRAEREVNRLNLKYGKEFCLRVAGIDADGCLHEIEGEST